MKLRVLIADDEALSRERLRQFLSQEPSIEVVAECTTGSETWESIRRASPDLVFLDIQMPEMDGFAVLEKFKGAPLPVIIFVSAYDQFAVRAFDIQAVDYLLKPFDRARFQTAFKRAVERLEAIASPRGQSASSGRPRQLQGRLAIKSQGRISFLPTSEISWIAAADNYVELHVSKTTHLVRMTMKEVESQFPEHAFVRISRSHIVNLEQVKELRSKSHGDALVVLHDGTVLPASRIYARQLRTLIRNCV